jgi:hypothetical protein
MMYGVMMYGVDRSTAEFLNEVEPEPLTSVVYTQFPLESVVDPVAVIVTTAMAPVMGIDDPVSVTVTTTTASVSAVTSPAC